MIINEEDYYKILGVNCQCNDKQIKSAFRKLALQYHPDHNSSLEAKEKFRKICEAYEILKDPQKRATYDQFSHETFKDTHKTFKDTHKTFESEESNESKKPTALEIIIWLWKTEYGIMLFLTTIFMAICFFIITITVFGFPL